MKCVMSSSEKTRRARIKLSVVLVIFTIVWTTSSICDNVWLSWWAWSKDLNVLKIFVGVCEWENEKMVGNIESLPNFHPAYRLNRHLHLTRTYRRIQDFDNWFSQMICESLSQRSERLCYSCLLFRWCRFHCAWEVELSSLVPEFLWKHNLTDMRLYFN